MRQTMKSVGRSLLLVASLISLTFFLMSPGAIHAQPVPPHLFTGVASIDGSPAPDGTAVSAWVQGEKVAAADTSDGEYVLIVHQPEGANYSGSVVNFMIAELEAHEISTWEIGEVEELALNAFSGDGPYVAPASTELVAEISRERRAIFGDVVGLEEGDILLIRTKDGDPLFIRLMADTQFRNVVIGRDDQRPVHVGDRIAAVLVEREGRLETQSVLVLTGTGSVTHVTGALIEGRLITEDGRSVQVELGLSNAVLEPGTVVTIVGHVSAETGAVRVRSLQRIEETIQRLSDHVEKITRVIPDRESQAHHLGRIQRLLEKASGHQLQILNEALRRHPDVARLGMERALSNLDYANNAAAQAFNQALRLTGPSFPPQETF